MKRITTFLVFIFTVAFVNAQTTTNLLPLEVVKSRLEKNIEKSNHPKKSLKYTTWIDLAEAYMLAGEVNSQGIRTNMPLMEANLLLGTPVSKTQEEYKGKAYEVQVYENFKLYFSEGGLAFWKDINLIDEKAFEKADQALQKALEVDEKGKASKKVTEVYVDLARKYKEFATNYYQMGEYAKAADYFAELLKINEKKEINVVDTVYFYFTGLSYKSAGNIEKAIDYYKKSIDVDFTDEGNLYAEIAVLQQENGNEEAASKTLEEGFAKFPRNSNIMGALINVYLKTGKDPKDILSLIEAAKAENPANSSLFVVEGNLYEKLGENDKAVEAYNIAIEKDDKSLYAYYSLGNMYINKANAYIKEANDLPAADFKAYDAKIEQANKQFKLAIPHLEKAREVAPNDKDILEILKQLLFRFRTESDEMMKKYEEVQAAYDSM